MSIEKLTPEVAIKFGMKKARLKDLKDETDKMADQIKELCEPLTDDEGSYEYAPKQSPFKLCYSEYDRSKLQWKTVAENLLKQVYGKRWKKELARLTREAGTIPIRELESKPNGAYRPVVKEEQ